MATYRFCEKCNKKYRVEYRNQRYCSNKCQKDLPYYRKRLKCTVCGKIFKPKPQQKGMCKECRHKYYVSSSILERDQFTCIYCGSSSYEDSAELHIDHIHPYSKGGLNIAQNLVTACERCNLEKQDRPLRNPEPILLEVKKRNLEYGLDDNLVIRLERGTKIE